MKILFHGVRFGEPPPVQAAFRKAYDRASVVEVVDLLQKLRYVYTYHQAIPCYLEGTGFSNDLLDRVRRFPMEYDFYLAPQMGET